MAEKIGQKILHGINKGIHEFKNNQGGPTQVGSGGDPSAGPPGNRSINNDERILSPSGRGTYPRMTRLSDGSILAAYTQFEG